MNSREESVTVQCRWRLEPLRQRRIFNEPVSVAVKPKAEL